MSTTTAAVECPQVLRDIGQASEAGQEREEGDDRLCPCRQDVRRPCWPGFILGQILAGSAIVVGSVYLNDCPLQPMIPIFLIGKKP